MRATPKTLLVAIAILAIGAAQVFGLSRGFVCYCDGVPVQVTADHCHSEGDGCDHHHPENEGSDHHDSSKRHLVNKLDVTVTPGCSGQQVPPAMVAVLPDFLVSTELFSELDQVVTPHRDVAMTSGVPPAALMVVHSTVFLI